MGEDQGKDLYATFAVPASGVPPFQAATTNLNSWTEAKVDTKNPDRGPLLIIFGEKDNTVPLGHAYAPPRSSSAEARLQRSSRSQTVAMRSR